MWANTFLSPYLLPIFLALSEQSPHQCGVQIGLYTFPSGWSICIGWYNTRGYRGIYHEVTPYNTNVVCGISLQKCVTAVSGSWFCHCLCVLIHIVIRLLNMQLTVSWGC